MSACDQWRQALLEGVPAPGLTAHVATCEECRALRHRLDVIDRLAAELAVPPVPDRLEGSLGRSYRLWRSQAAVVSVEVSKHLQVVIGGRLLRPPALDGGLTPTPATAVGEAIMAKPNAARRVDLLSGEEEARHQAQSAVRPRRGGAERAILRAGARLLEERGVQRMSMKAVAAAARVSKATIYRRWPSKDALILDLVAGAVEDGAGDASGSASAVLDARAELLAWVRSGLEAERGPRGAALQHLVRRATEDPVLAATLRRRILRQHRDRFVAIVQRGVGAGQIRADVDVGTLLDLVSGPLIYRRLIATSDPTDRDPDEHAVAIVAMLWPGICAAPPRALQ